MQPPAEPAARIDRDVQPVWETEVLPDWVSHWLLPMLSAGQKWPGSSESGMSTLALAYGDLAVGVVGTAPRAGGAVRAVATGWSSPASADFVSRAKFLYGHEAGMAGVAGNSESFKSQAHNFAVETQYSKLSVNVAFWVTVVAIAIALFVAFFTAGSSTALIGPYAAAARAAISRILVRLAMVGARQLGVSRLARVTTLSGATGRGLITRLLGSSIGRELIEEIGEEFFIDAAAQYQQIQMGTRKDWDWKKSRAAVIGAGSGALAGTVLAGPMSNITRHMPGFPGRAMTTGLTNTIASPFGSVIANRAVYGQWENPFTVDSIMGGFMGGAGRTGSISPFNPEVYTTLANPVTALASAYDTAARTDAARAGGGDPGAGGPAPSGGPVPGGTVHAGAPAPNQNDDVRRGAPSSSATDPDTTPRRGSTSRDNRQDDTSREPRADNTDDTADDTDTTPQTPDQQSRGNRTPQNAPDPAQDDSQAPDPAQNDSQQDDSQQDTGDTQPSGNRTAAPDAQTTADDSNRPATPDTTDDTAGPDTSQSQDNQQNPQQDDQQDTQQTPQQDTQQDTQQNPQQNAQQDTQQDNRPAPAAAQQADGPATQSAAAPDDAPPTPVPVIVRARTALMDSLTVDFPGAVVGPNGDLLIPTADGGVRVIRAATMRRVRSALDARAEQVTDADELQAEATALVMLAAQMEETRQPATSRPGTVTSRPVPGTRYVADARPGTQLQPEEVRTGADAVRPHHFQGQGVISITWSADGTTLIVRTQNNGTHYFRPVVGNMTEGLMGETELSRNNSERRPHVVHFAPGMDPSQVSRVWLHEITDTLQKTQETGTGRRRGFLRRRQTTSEPTQDMCAQAQLNELAFMAEQWRQARTPQEQRLLALDIDGVSRQLAERGHTPPLPPWAPAQASRPTQAAPLPNALPTQEELPGVIDALKRAEQTLKDQVAAKRKTAEEAGEAAAKSRIEARKADRQLDQGHEERARKARQETRNHRATQQRHTRIADAYEAALQEATRARQEYEQLLMARRQIGRPQARGEVSIEFTVARLAAQATQHHAAYLQALAEALPQEISLAGAQPTGRLAHLSALTTAVNTMLKNNGVQQSFTANELEQAIRADFHKAVSPDGLVLQVGQHGKAAEVRIKLSLADLVEVIDPAIKGSEMMVGLFFQAARTASAGQAGSLGLSMGFDTTVLAKLLPEDNALRTVGELFGVGLGIGLGRNWSTGGGAGMYAQGGSVSDNRSESLLFDAAATWTVDIRTGQDKNWRGTTVVDTGAQGDPAGQRLWFSHSVTDQPARKLAKIPARMRGAEMPNVIVQSMSNLEDALDQLATALGGDYAEVGTAPRDALRSYVTQELPHRLRTAVNGGLERVFTRDGKPHARVRAESRVDLVASTPVGGATSEEWEEEVLVDFVGTPGGASTGGSLEGNASAGFKHPALDGVDLGEYAPSIGPKVRGARPSSRSYSATANKQAIHPSVHRKTSPKQSYRLMVVTTFTVEVIGKPPVTLKPVLSEVFADMRESAAYRFGLPVDSEALVYKNGQPVTDAQGNHVLRGDPSTDPPPGRKPELPEWLGDGPGQMRGAGPALVQEIEGLDKIRQDVLKELAERGIIPKTVNGVPQYSSNALTRASQILNEQEVMEQLSEHRIRSAYDTLAQDGIVLDLTLQGLNSAPEHYMLRLSLKQDFNQWSYVGHTDAQTVVNLDIGSDTSARAIGTSRTYSGGASVSESDGPNKGQDGLSHEAGVNGGGNRTRSVGSSAGGTVNVVTLQESNGPVAIFSLSHNMTVDLLHNGTTTEISSHRGSAQLVFAADLLPSTKPTPPARLGRMSPKLRAKARLLHMDVGQALDAARRVLPRGMTADSVAFQHLMSFLSVRNLVAHPKLLNRPLTTDVAVRPEHGTTRSSLSVSGEVGETEVLGVVDQVTGEILFGLGSAGISWGGSSGLSTGASVSGSDLDGGGTSSDGVSVTPFSRSGGTSESSSILDIWGSEELTIEFGRQYILRSTVDLTLTGSESSENGLPTGERIPVTGPSTTSTTGTALFTISEFDALLMYAEGDLDLPSHLVADAVERFLNGSLTLDRSLAVPLLQRYVLDMAQSGTTNEYTDRHTPQALLPKIKEVTGLYTPAAGSPQEQLDLALGHAADQLERSRDVVLAPPYDRTVGASSSESLNLTDENGNPVDIIDAVRSAVQDAVPGALDGSPTLGEELNVDFSSDAALIHVVDMWSSRGFERSYHVQQGPEMTQAEEVTVRVRLEPVGDSRRARFLSRTSQSGVIGQHYRYTDLSHSESYSGSYSVGLDQSANDQGDGQGSGLSTDRGRGYSGSTNHQGTRLQRIGLFLGLTRVEQQMKLVIEVERRPVRAGKVPDDGKVMAGVRAAANALRGRPRTAPPVTYDATLVRRIPTGMTRPAAEDPGPVVMAADPRQAELLPGYYTQALWEDPNRPSLSEVITNQLTKMLGAAAVQERRPELVRRLSVSGLLTAFERMTGPLGEPVVRVSRQKFKDQGVTVTVHARTSDLTIVAGPYEGEKGQVDRKADAQNVTVSRGRTTPVGWGGNMSDGVSGLNGGVRGGEQTSDSVSDHHGARRERSMFEKGKLYTVRLRVDYDVDYQYVARLRDGNEHPVGDPVHMPNASSGEVDVVMFGEEIEELRARMESNVRLAPPSPGGPAPATYTFVPDSSHQGPIQTLQEARLAARERGEVTQVAVWEPDGVHRFRVMPDGTLYSETPDGGFADAFASLAPELLDAAQDVGLDLRDLFMNSGTPGTFTDQVQAALKALDALPAPAAPAWPAPATDTGGQSAPVGGSVAQGVTPAAGMPSPAIENTPFSRSARPEGVPDLTMDELHEQPVSAVDLGGTAAHVGWTGENELTLQLPGVPDQHVRVLIEDPGQGLNALTEPRAGTPEDPHLLRISGRVHPDLVSSILVHDLSHVAQTATATAAGMPQGVIRTSPNGEHTEGTDLCLLPRLDEHTHLSGKWHAATDPATREHLAAAIDALAEDIRQRGHTPPPPPWGTGPRAPAAQEPQSRIARLLNGGSATGLDTSPHGLGKLAGIAGVSAVTPAAGAATNPAASPVGPADTFTVTTPEGSFTLTLAEAAPGATEVTAEPAAPGNLTLRVPAADGPRAMTAVAEHVAAHAAALPGRPGAAQSSDTGQNRPAPAEAAALARLRGLALAVDDAGPLRSRAERAALQAEARRLGLTGDQQGAPSKLVELARTGDLTPEQVTAIRGHATLPEMAAAGAIGRAAALMGARVHPHGPGLLDIVLPGRAPIAVEVRRPGSGPGDPAVLTYEVDPARTVGANERAAAATAAAAVARALGLSPADGQELAELQEAVRQARTATDRQRPGRLGVLYDLVTEARPEVLRMLPDQVAAQLATLAEGRRPRDLPATLDRLRTLANATGWDLPEAECVCPPDSPCTCGLRRDGAEPVTPPTGPEAVAV
ncbi:hypothetical protein DMB42_43570 [Nonomuraea sp. WAC 01424]|uniref:WXG100-like domain-containing protein n=1 Tax=Nonomuraea sp. WAC 01424 TaxID=2203200 RepID=UPI000F77D79A|nr:hypothetical protein [Nonomuraea sp. WAC 01424]RSM98641.1 hypothetical protein DMB42_43570 [Nonomuraea sp. WAC 01424]